jgi:hypothetical protein
MAELVRDERGHPSQAKALTHTKKKERRGRKPDGVGEGRVRTSLFFGMVESSNLRENSILGTIPPYLSPNQTPGRNKISMSCLPTKHSLKHLNFLLITSSQIAGVEVETFFTWVRSRQSINLSFRVIKKKYVDTLELKLEIHHHLGGCDQWKT